MFEGTFREIEEWLNLPLGSNVLLERQQAIDYCRSAVVAFQEMRTVMQNQSDRIRAQREGITKLLAEQEPKEKKRRSPGAATVHIKKILRQRTESRFAALDLKKENDLLKAEIEQLREALHKATSTVTASLGGQE